MAKTKATETKVAKKTAPGAELSVLKRRVRRLNSLLDVTKMMASERDFTRLLQLILQLVKKTLGAERCSLFILDEERKELWSKIAQGLEIREIRVPLGTGIAGHVAESGVLANLKDVYKDARFDRTWDIRTGYRTRAMLCVPMRDNHGRTVGVIQAINKRGGFSAEDEELLLALGTQAAACLDNALLNEEIDRLFEGFVRASVYAIESRDPTTSGHSERVALLTLGIADHLPRAAPKYSDVRFSPVELKEIRYAALLHDFGKVGVREHVLVKANKLSPSELELVRARFDLGRRDAELLACEQKVQLLERAGLSPVRNEVLALDQRLRANLEELDRFWAFIQECNRPTVLPEGSFALLFDIAKRSWPQRDGTQRPYLEPAEVEFLSITRGSLSEAERKEIESHVVHTYRFLATIPWTRELKNVPQIAYAHHEKLDGRGYPLRLLGDAIPLPSKMMAISDIYDALTASDRPYKKAVPHERALDILGDEAKQGKIDGELLSVFIDARVHERLRSLAPSGPGAPVTHG